MRTSIFNNFGTLTKDFREDFDKLWALPQPVRSGLIEHVAKVAKTRTNGEKKIALDQAVSAVGGSPPDVLRVLNLLQYIYKEWNPLQDTPTSFLRDLGELSLVPPDKVEEGKTFMLEFLGEVEKDNTYRLQKMFASSILPSYAGALTLVDFRAIIRKPFGSGLDDHIEEYEPTCIGFAPVIIAEIKRDSGDPTSFRFQCEEDSLERLITILQAALRDLKAANRSLPGGTAG